jgi:hypothetical protein
MKITPDSETKETKTPSVPILEEKVEKPQVMILFGDNIHQMNPRNGKSFKISKENGWSYSNHAVHVQGYIFVISSMSGDLYKW